MDTRSIARAVALYTVVVGIATVAGVYLLFHSGLYILVVLAAGMVLMALGSVLVGGTSATSLGGVGASFEEDIGESVSEQTTSGRLPVRPSEGVFGAGFVLILYGTGLVVWSVVALTVFRSGLQ